VNTLVPFLLVALALLAAFGASLRWAGGGRLTVLRGQAFWLLVIAPLTACALYVMRGEPGALMQAESAAHAADGMAASVQRLAERLKAQPNDVAGWLMLARSYGALERPADAAAAYEQAEARAPQDAMVLVEWIEARLAASERRFDARTHELVARAARLAPQEPDVLMLRALAAYDQGNRPVAVAMLKALREHYPEGSPDRKAMDAAIERLAQGKALLAEPAAAGR
jgi:cytochrome c-type biogenesis protein CcmH